MPLIPTIKLNNKELAEIIKLLKRHQYNGTFTIAELERNGELSVRDNNCMLLGNIPRSGVREEQSHNDDFPFSD